MSSKTKTTATKENGKPALVPKLRFAEFRMAKGWEKSRLSEITSAIFDGTHQTPKYTAEGIPFYSVENLISGNANKFISRGDYELATKKNKPEQGDILITRIGKIGHSEVVTWSHEFSIYVTLAVIKQGPRFNSHFLHHYLQSGHYQKEILSKSLLNAVPCKINMDSLRATHVLLASPAEQQKIAECLSSVDELIAAQARKLDALKTHKKGLMQQLFPREGETQPRLRFPKFQNAGEWRPCTVADFAKVTTGGRDTQNKVEGGKYPFFVRSQTVERIDSYSHDGEAVLTSGDGVGVGKNYHYIKGKFDFHQRVYCIYDFAEKVSGQFFYLYFSEHFGERVMRMTAKNSVDSVRMAMITEMPVMLPPISEQQRIADCLTRLDDLIAAQTQTLEALKTHKQGLMQQLFPAPAA